MNFKLEKEMIPIIKDRVGNLFRIGAIAEELPVNHRIVDLVVADIIFSELRNLLVYKTAFKKLTLAELDVLADIYIREQVTIHYLKKKLRMDAETVKRTYLNKFLNNNLIVKISKYKYKTTEWSQIKIKHMISIEVKLSNWKNVLNQGIDNLTFADYSYVALDESICSSKKIMEKFMEKNVGVLSVSNKNMIELVYKPKINRFTKPNDYALQRIILCRDIICNQSKWHLL